MENVVKKVAIVALALMFIGMTNACKTTEHPTTDLQGEWLIKSVGERTVTGDMEKEPFIGFNTDEKRIYGNASCNSIMGGYAQKENSLEFDHVGSTRMMCRDMQFEDAILQAINNTQQFRISGNKMLLYDASGKELMQLEKK